MRSGRKRRIELHRDGRRAGEIVLVPGPADYRGGTYFWVGDGDGNCVGYTKARTRQMSAFAHAILRAIGEDPA